MSIITFEDVIPVERLPPVVTPWTRYRVDYSAATTLPGRDDASWVLGAPVDLNPVDDDPAEPQPRSFSVSGNDGWYRPVFIDAAGNENLTDPPLQWPDPRARIIPAPQEIGSINRARTIVDDLALGTFTTQTNPALEEVERIAVIAADDVADSLGTVPAQFADRARRAAALVAAALVEAGAREPKQEQIKFWSDLAESKIAAIATAMEQVGAGDEEGPSDAELAPVYSFPVACPLPYGA